MTEYWKKKKCLYGKKKKEENILENILLQKMATFTIKSIYLLFVHY